MSSYKEITKWYADHLDEALDDNKALRTKLEVAEDRIKELEHQLDDPNVDDSNGGIYGEPQ